MTFNLKDFDKTDICSIWLSHSQRVNDLSIQAWTNVEDPFGYKENNLLLITKCIWLNKKLEVVIGLAYDQEILKKIVDSSRNDKIAVDYWIYKN